MKMMCRGLLVWALWLAGLVATGAEEKPVPRASIPEMREAPAIDGVVGDGEWRDAVENDGFVSLNGKQRLCDRQGRFWVGRKGETLYLAFRTETPPGNSILIRVKPDGNRDLRDAFADDSIELVIDPKRGRPAGDRMYYHIIFNANGALYDFSVDPDNKANPRNTAWRLPAWDMKSSQHDGWWDVEAAIPFASLDTTAADLATPWGMRIARNWKRPFQQSQWETKSAAYDDQGTMPVVVWNDAAPVVQNVALRDPGVDDKSAVRVVVRNPHATPLPVAVYLQDAWHMDQLQVVKQTVTLAPDSEQTFTVSAPDGGPSGDHHTIINVTSPDGKQVYYFRDFPWNLHRAADAWKVEEVESKKIDLKFKYYPYYHKVRVWVNATGLGKVKPTAANASIVRLEKPGGVSLKGTPIWQSRIPFDGPIADTIAEIPDLTDGDFRLIVVPEGKGVPKEPLTQDFVRKHFPWEHNQLGISDKVITPFTPITLDGNSVGCVQRQFEHADNGLWRQVTSVGKEVLSGPMAWDVELGDGTKPAVVGRGWQATSHHDTELVGNASWQAGPVKAGLETRYDYDGLMVCTLSLQPCDVPVRSLSLRIPLNDSLAQVMHACGDGNRHNYAGAVPAGDGPVWDSSQGNKLEIIGTFYPYLWVGDGERGLCWFADSDRDWVLDDTTPVLDLVREGGTLWLNVHFITRPGPLKREHKIVFGLQTTPTKPMPDGWRRWVFGQPVPGGRPVRVMGHSRYWGALYYLPYPLDRDFSFFGEMKRLREMTGGKPDARNAEFVANWMKHLSKYFPEGSPRYTANLRSINAGMRVAVSSPWADGWRLFGYTNGRGISHLTEEFPTFQDEWLNYLFYGRDWNPLGQVTYDATPSTSMVDCLTWYYRYRLTCMDGVYWDCFHLAARHDPVVGGAWTDEEGRVHPGLGIFALRELVKRTAVMFDNEEQTMPPGRRPLITLAHMTNTLVVPVLSFANCTLDWEWKYGTDDFQDRFTPELTRAETIGRQVGAWPTILAGGHSKGRPDDVNQRVWRTRMGVCLVHELSPWDYQPPSDGALRAKLFEFGYGAPGCTVYNYWQDTSPVRVESKTVDGKTLVIAKPGAALVVVTDYGDGGPCTVTLDLKALGLGDGVKGTDFETGDAVRQAAPGQFELDLPRHDFTIIRVE